MIDRSHGVGAASVYLAQIESETAGVREFKWFARAVVAVCLAVVFVILVS